MNSSQVVRKSMGLGRLAVHFEISGFRLCSCRIRPISRFFLLSLILVLLPTCSSNTYRFEDISNDPAVAVPLEFTGITGRRDGASVRGEMSFVNGADSARIDVLIELVPPATFRSGAYRMTIGGRTIEGPVESTSLDYLGGQNTLPSIGGVFILKDSSNRPLYRVRVPPTLLTRKLEF